LAFDPVHYQPIDRRAAGWSDLVAAVKTRNRITHPTSLTGIQLSGEDIRRVDSAAKWFHELVIELFLVASRCLDKQVEGMLHGLEREFGEERVTSWRVAQRPNEDEDGD
jgi:hypothetical protein